MTPEYAVLPPHFTVPEALAELRRRFAGKLDDVHYVYVTDEAECLLGVLSLWDLIVADPQSRLADFMETNVVSVRTDQKAEEAARLIARYNLLALPVVNEEGRLVGIVAVDDAMDLILPEAWRQQLPRMY
jgi:Mg/Co/Ni transporter MgtE